MSRRTMTEQWATCKFQHGIAKRGNMARPKQTWELNIPCQSSPRCLALPSQTWCALAKKMRGKRMSRVHDVAFRQRAKTVTRMTPFLNAGKSKTGYRTRLRATLWALFSIPSLTFLAIAYKPLTPSDIYRNQRCHFWGLVQNGVSGTSVFHDLPLHWHPSRLFDQPKCKST